MEHYLLPMACWTPGPWDLVADPAAAAALRVCSAAAGDVLAYPEAPVNCPMPKTRKPKVVAPVVEEPATEPEE
jgi:hypothetical protein